MPVTADDLLAELPPFLRRDPTIRAVQAAHAAELGVMEGLVETIKANMFPQTADEILSLYEAFLDLPDSSALPLSQRRDILLTQLRRVTTTGSGAEWEDNMATLFGGQWSYKAFKPVVKRLVNRAERPSMEDGITTGYSQSSGSLPNTSSLTATQDWSKAGAWSLRAQIHREDSALVVVARTHTGASAYAIDPTKVQAGRVSARLRAILAATGTNNIRARFYWYKPDGSASSIALTTDGPLFSQPVVGEYDMLIVAAPPADAGRASLAVMADSDQMVYNVDMDVDAYAIYTLDDLALSDLWSQTTQTSGGYPIGAEVVFHDKVYRSKSVGVATSEPPSYASKWDEVGSYAVPAYGDGSMPGWEWLGAANSSQSRETSPDVHTIEVDIPFASGSIQATVAERLARDITPANVLINVSYGEGFLMGRSTMGDLL
jgi:hypothetical protein